MIELLTKPAPAATERPPADSGAGRYVRSFLVMRLVVGGLGVAMPILLVFVDRYAFHGDPSPRDSLSAYYYSGMREVFVVILGTTGFFLIAYKITEKNLDNTLSILAGLAAITVPVFPTGRPSALVPTVPLNALQNWIGEDWTKWIHFGAAAVFIVALGVVSILFGLREGERDSHGERVPARFWRGYHFICAGVIGLAVIWIVATLEIFDGPSWSLLAGETACTLAFGASWFVKGAEIDYVLGRAEKVPAAEAPAAIQPSA